MGIEFTLRESSTLYELVAENTDDIILKTDRAGFIRHASPAIARLGFPLQDMLIGPNILDIVDETSAPAIEIAHKRAIEGRASREWTECYARTAQGQARWFAIRMSSLTGEDGRAYGALCVMRDMKTVHELQERLFTTALTDRLTGLTNRTAFVSMLRHLVEIEAPGCLAVFDLDHFRAINLRHGLSAGDRILVAFATFLKNQARSQDIVSRIGGESFAILLPHIEPERAGAICRRIVAELADLGQSTRSARLSLTASVGVARIGETLDGTIKSAELAVFLAKAKGRNCVELADEKWP